MEPKKNLVLTANSASCKKHLKPNMVTHLWGPGSKKSLQLQPDQKIHRTDMLLKTMMSVLKDITALLRLYIDKLEATTTWNSSFLHQVLKLDRQAQHLKVVLQLLYKVNLEIVYWRAKFYEYLKKQSSEVELIRQRIMWLEQRLEKIVSENSRERLSEMFRAPVPILTSKTEQTEMPPKYGEYFVPTTSTSLPFKKSVSLKTIAKALLTDEPHAQLEFLDEGGRYWLSDHHRFIYTPDVKNLLKENPLSYHSVGLAVPASYVDKKAFASEQQEALPWITEQDPMKGNFDIMREDLESLRSRIFQIHNKIHNAARLSLNLNDEFTKPTLRVQSGTPESISTMTSYGEDEQAADQPSRSSSAAFEKKQSLHVTADPVDVLPITRTNFSKKYPYLCDHWSSARPDGVDQQPIIVNQRDLKNKTKLRLFVLKRQKKSENIERDLVTPSSVTSNRSYRKGATTVKFIENLKSSDGSVLSDLQLERLQDLMTMLSTSSRVGDRVYAARALSSLGATALEKALPVLTDALSDRDLLVRFAAAKALINLGEWNEKALKQLNVMLKMEDRDVCIEVMNVLACSKQARSIIVDIDEKPRLTALIQIMASYAASDDEGLSFHASVCLGEICSNHDEQIVDLVRKRLLVAIKMTSKWDWHSQALEVLVRRLNFIDDAVLKAAITQLKHATKWKDRVAAALLVAHAGPTKVFPLMEEEEAFNVFFPKLWDDPKREVRVGVSQVFTALGLRNRLLETLDLEITNPNPDTRAHAVMGMSAAGIRSDKTLRSLIEMLGLDSSDYVRLQIMRTFHALTITDIRAVRALREREKSGGPLAREASKILASLDVRLTTGLSSVGPSRTSRRSQNQVTLHIRSETDLSWFQSPWRNSRVTTKQSKRYSSRRGHASSSYRSSSDFASSPRYEIISTSGQRLRRSAIKNNRVPTAGTHVSSVSSLF